MRFGFRGVATAAAGALMASLPAPSLAVFSCDAADVVTWAGPSGFSDAPGDLDDCTQEAIDYGPGQIDDCVGDLLDHYSASCQVCFESAVACGAFTCAASCGPTLFSDPSAACMQCLESQCLGAFVACSSFELLLCPTCSRAPTASPTLSPTAAPQDPASTESPNATPSPDSGGGTEAPTASNSSRTNPQNGAPTEEADVTALIFVGGAAGGVTLVGGAVLAVMMRRRPVAKAELVSDDPHSGTTELAVDVALASDDSFAFGFEDDTGIYPAAAVAVVLEAPVNVAKIDPEDLL